MEDNLFSEKIRYLHKELNIGDTEFTKLFWNEKNKPTLLDRKKAVIGNWIIKGIKGNAYKFEYEKYDIATKKVDGKIAFPKKAFLEESLEEFKERVDSYIQNKRYETKNNKFEFEYRYIYYFDILSREIQYLKLDIIGSLSEKKVKIKLTPSNFYEEVQTYYGYLEIIPDYYYLWLKNDFEIVSFYFSINKGFLNRDKLHGLRLGLSYDERLPISAKNVLTKKEIIEERELDEIYLNINENENLLLERSSIHGKVNIKINFIKKIQKTIENLNIFTKNIKKKFEDKIFNDIYFAIFYESFRSLNQIIQRVQQEKTYYVASRERVTNTFLTILAKEKTYCHIVYPLLRETSMFNEKSNVETKEDIELNIKMAKLGLKIIRILVIDEEYIVTDYFINIINRMVESGIDIYMVYKKDIANFVVSYDFIYNKEINIAGYRNIEERKCYFKISKDQDKIKNLENDFYKILNKSYSFEEFKSKKGLIKDRFLERLIGSWNLYFYSSIKKDDNQYKLWHNKIEIYKNSSVKYLWNNELILQGFIDTKFNIGKAIIYLNHLKTGNLTIITFKKNRIHKNIFKVTITDSQAIDDNYDMASFGILSKAKQSEELIRNTLGDDMSKIMLCEENRLERDITKIYTKSRF